MARIAIGGFHHETNCFVPGVTDYDYFATHRTARRCAGTRISSTGCRAPISRYPAFWN